MAYSHLLKKLPPDFDVLIPFIRFEKELERELLLLNRDILYRDSKYFITPKSDSKPLWAQDWLRNCECIPFASKNEAVKVLRSQSNLGVHFETEANPKLAEALRRELRELKLRRIDFKVPSDFNFRYFAWGLLDDSHLILCREPQSQFPLGWHEFNEDKNTPPNRAYLKLWEILCLGHIQLKPTDIAIDVGSSPGGWSWVLSRYLQKVYSLDKAPLSPKIASLRNIHYTSADAFAADPAAYPDCTWLFSDIICTPSRLLELIENWHTKSEVQNYVCTIKFKGDCDFDILKEFRRYPDSRIIHLYQNKNEVTWIKQVKK